MTGLEILFATILSSALAQFGASTLTGTIIGGVVGNRIDALFVKAFEGIQGAFAKGVNPLALNQAMEQALIQSYYQALISLVDECKNEAIGDSSKKYRGVRQLSESERQIVDELDGLRLQYQREAKIPFEKLKLSSFVPSSLPVSSSRNQGLPQTLKDFLIALAMKDIRHLPLAEKIGSDSLGLWPRMIAFFSQALHKNEELKDFYQLNILIQLKQTSEFQQVSLNDLQRHFESMSQLLPQIQGAVVALNQNLSQAHLSLEDGQNDIKNKLDSILSQKQEFQPTQSPANGNDSTMSNPFTPLTGIVSDAEQRFIPYESVGYFFELLNASPGIAIIGDEGMGKSTLLKILQSQAINKLPSHSKTVFIDCKKIKNEAEFFGEFCFQAGIEVSQNASELERRIGNKTFFLLLDEVDKMAWSGFTCEIRAQLRGFAESGWLKIALTARKSLDQLFPDSRGISPFSGVCLEHAVELWSEDESEKFIRARLQKTSVRFSDVVIQGLISESQGYPRRLMNAAFEMYRKSISGV